MQAMVSRDDRGMGFGVLSHFVESLSVTLHIVKFIVNTSEDCRF